MSRMIAMPQNAKIFKELVEQSLSSFFQKHDFVFEEFNSPEAGVVYLFYKNSECKIKFYEEDIHDHERNCLIAPLQAANDYSWGAPGLWFFLNALAPGSPHTSVSTSESNVDHFCVLETAYETALSAVRLVSKPQAISIYLGSTNIGGGYDPIGDKLERLRKAYPNNFEILEKDVKKILDETLKIQVDWNNYPWPKAAGDFVEKRLNELYPWTSAQARLSLASYFAYQWK